jgi:hypothetical protein
MLVIRLDQYCGCSLYARVEEMVEDDGGRNVEEKAV